MNKIKDEMKISLPIRPLASVDLSRFQKKDVHFGRGGQLNKLRKGSLYQFLLDSAKDDYFELIKDQNARKKEFIIERVVNPIINAEGRFFMHDDSSSFVTELVPEDPHCHTLICTKILQAFRDFKRKHKLIKNGESSDFPATRKKTNLKVKPSTIVSSTGNQSANETKIGDSLRDKYSDMSQKHGCLTAGEVLDRSSEYHKRKTTAKAPIEIHHIDGNIQKSTNTSHTVFSSKTVEMNLITDKSSNEHQTKLTGKSSDGRLSQKAPMVAIVSPPNVHRNRFTFPKKLFALLQSAQFSPIIDWLSDGRAFVIKDPQNIQLALNSFDLAHSTIRSFHRQLCIWGFSRVTNKEEKKLFLQIKPEIWQHPFFQKDMNEKYFLKIQRDSKRKALKRAQQGATVENSQGERDLYQKTTRFDAYKGACFGSEAVAYSHEEVKHTKPQVSHKKDDTAHLDVYNNQDHQIEASLHRPLFNIAKRKARRSLSPGKPLPYTIPPPLSPVPKDHDGIFDDDRKETGINWYYDLYERQMHRDVYGSL